MPLRRREETQDKNERIKSSELRSEYSSIRSPGIGRHSSTAFRARSSLPKKITAVKSSAGIGKSFNSASSTHPRRPRNRRTDLYSPCPAIVDSGGALHGVGPNGICGTGKSIFSPRRLCDHPTVHFSHSQGDDVPSSAAVADTS